HQAEMAPSAFPAQCLPKNLAIRLAGFSAALPPETAANQDSRRTAATSVAHSVLRSPCPSPRPPASRTRHTPLRDRPKSHAAADEIPAGPLRTFHPVRFRAGSLYTSQTALQVPLSSARPCHPQNPTPAERRPPPPPSGSASCS